MPGTHVDYRISVDGIQAEGSFVSAPSLSAKSLTFYGYGDTRGGLDLLKDAQYVNHNYVEREIMDDLRQDPSVRQTFCLNLGDFVTCGLDEAYWDQQYFNRNLHHTPDFQAHLPIMGTIGNHESYLPGFSSGTSPNCQPLQPGQGANCEIIDGANAGKLYYKYFPYAMYPFPKGSGNYRDYYYYFDYGPARFISLDAINSSFRVDSPQYLWASETLVPSRPWNIVCIHIPLWSARNTHRGTVPQNLRQNLQPLFEAKNVPLVVQGHEHYYSRCLVNGITYLTIAGGGADLYDPIPYDTEPIPYILKAKKVYHFAKFEISGSTMTVTIIDKDGRIVDVFKILPPAGNLFPLDGAPTSLSPTLISSPFLSQDGAKHVSSQWIVRESFSRRTVFITNRNGIPTFDGKNLTSFTVPSNILQPLHRYNWQVIYKDSNGNTTRPSLATTFYAGEIYILSLAKLTLSLVFRY